MTVSIIVPFRSTDENRIRIWRFLFNRYKRIYPDWEIVGGSCNGQWRKGEAVRDAVLRSYGDVLVIADADVLMRPEPLREAVERVRSGAPPWVIPHGLVYRLNEDATDQALETGKLFCEGWRQQLVEGPRTTTPGGGITVLSRETYDRVPMDRRFAQWGHEDQAWGLALKALAGDAVYLNSPMWHLWHEPAYAGLREGSEGSKVLLMKYQAAAHDPGRMGELVADG